MAKRTAAAAGAVQTTAKTQRSLPEWLGIMGEVVQLKDTAYAAAQADGRVTVGEWLGLSDQVLAVLERHQVTIQELRAFLKTAEPLLGLLKVR